MGFFNDEINLSEIPETQQYKLAGNGWDVNVAKKIFECLFKDAKLNTQQKSLW